MNATWIRIIRTSLAAAALVAAMLASPHAAPQAPAAVKQAPAATKPVTPAAQPAPIDRTKIPPAGKPPVLRVPTWTRTTLANGAELIISEKHDLPLVSFSMNFMGGSAQFEPADKRGLASLTASMMSEGTKTRDGEALSNAMQLLGTTIGVGIGNESGIQ